VPHVPPPPPSWFNHLNSIRWSSTKSHILFHCLGRAKESVQVRGALKYFATIKNVYGEGLLSPWRTPRLEDHPLSDVRDCLFNIIAAAPRTRRTSLHPQPEDAPCRGDKEPTSNGLVNCIPLCIFWISSLLSSVSLYPLVSMSRFQSSLTFRTK
jgi:hypothetical protein